MKLFTPHYFEDNFFNINFDKLKKDGIKLIITDIDNTLVPYAVATPTQKINRLFEKLQMMGFDICFLSNNQSQRVDVFNEGLGYYSVSLSRKPLPYGYKQCMQYHNCTKEETVFIGDGASHILSISLPGYKSEVLMNFLDRDGICISKSSACKKGARSHVLEAMGLSPRVIDGAVRISFSRFSTKEEVDFFVEKLAEAVKRLIKT